MEFHNSETFISVKILAVASTDFAHGHLMKSKAENEMTWISCDFARSVQSHSSRSGTHVKPPCMIDIAKTEMNLAVVHTGRRWQWQ